MSDRPDDHPEPAERLPRLKLFGAFRSGTNYVKTLLEVNYRVRVATNDGGFKHFPVPARFRGAAFQPFPMPILLVAKDPYAWLTSMWVYVQGAGARHVRCGDDFARFLTDPLFVTSPAHDDFPEHRFASPVDYWNAINHSALSLSEERRTTLRYESLLEASEQTVAEVARRYDLQMRRTTTSEGFRDTDQRTRNMMDRPRTDLDDYVTDQSFDATPYLEHRYLEAFTDAQIDQVAARLDPDVCAALDYPRLPARS